MKTHTKTLPFIKMSGAGNDFVVIETPRRQTNYRTLATKVCNRKTGIGADGLLVLGYSRQADYRMRIINADGSEAEMCGNGARCLAAYIFRHKRPSSKALTLQTGAGIISCQELDGKVQIQLSNPKGYRPDINIKIFNRPLRVHFINTGVPHAVVFVDGLDAIDVRTLGQAIRWHKHFAPKGTNVNFVEQINEDTIAVRTFERGVEDETLACGTGSTASAIITHLLASPQTIYRKNAHTNVLTSSGEPLEVIFDNNRKKIFNVWLKGPVRFIAEGHYFLEA